MARILTVDDSRSVRMIVSRELQALGHDVDEAEDGEKGLEKLEELSYDLVVLDVTMPVLDGPGMLTKMREKGDKTPVLMLTSESKRSIIAGLLKLGIDDYILKPFKSEDLKAKVAKALKQDGGASSIAPVEAASSASAASSSGGGAGGGGGAGAAPSADGAKSAFGDILVIDDMENVQKRLRQMVPEHLTVSGCLNMQTALTACRDRGFRAILIDADLPDCNSTSLMRQVRALQPRAVVVALYLRSANNVTEEARKAGFDGALMKPFDAGAIEDFLLQHFNAQELISKDDNVLKIGAFKGRETRLDGYFIEVQNAIARNSEEIAAACYAEVVVDVSALPTAPERVARLMLEMKNRITKMGLEIRLVGGADIAKVLKQYTETSDLALFQTVNEALKAA